jgi:type VI secretion system protein ImpK
MTKPSLREASADLFAMILAFRAASNEERSPYRVFRQEVMDRLAEFDRRAERDRLDPNGEARFALIALADETVMSSDWEDAAEWSRNPLQMHYYGDFTAGERFFERMEKLTAGTDDDLLEVYFTCLAAGFRGRYRDDPATLGSIRSRIFHRLTIPNLRDETHLTPEAYGRSLERPLLTRRIPFAWITPFALAVIGLYVAYYVILQRQVGDIVQVAAKPLAAGVSQPTYGVVPPPAGVSKPAPVAPPAAQPAPPSRPAQDRY